MTYCVQCGTKVKETNRHCNTCSVSMGLQNHHSNHLLPANPLASQTPSYLNTGSTLASETERPYIFIYIVIIVTYFLLTSGLWIHKNHQASISLNGTALNQHNRSPERILSKTAIAHSTEKKPLFPNLKSPQYATKKAPEREQNQTYQPLHIQPRMLSIFNHRSCWRF